MKRPLTLSALITLYVGGGLLLLTLALGLMIQQGISRVLDDALYTRADALAKQLATVSLDAIMIYDYGTLERYVRDLSVQPDLLYLQIRRQDGEVLAEAGVFPESFRNPAHITLTRPILLGGNPLGEITMSYDRSQADGAIRRLTAAGLSGVLLLGLILYYLLKHLLERRLIQPVQMLAEQASPLRRGERPDPALLPEELARVARTFGALCKELEAYSSENERIQRLARHATERLCQEKRLATVGQIAAELAHSLNTPLGNILGYAQQARRDTRDGKMLTRLGVIEEQARTCAGVVRNLLTASRPPEAHPRPVDLKAQITGIIDLIRPVLRDRGVAIPAVEGNLRPRVWADPACIEQVLFNLLGNAADAGARNTRIRLDESDHRGILILEDDGPGIPEELKPRLFEPFVSGKPPGEGTGLGLHICKTLLHSVGAEFELIESRPGRTRFRVAWRLAEAPR